MTILRDLTILFLAGVLIASDGSPAKANDTEAEFIRKSLADNCPFINENLYEQNSSTYGRRFFAAAYTGGGENRADVPIKEITIAGGIPGIDPTITVHIQFMEPSSRATKRVSTRVIVAVSPFVIYRGSVPASGILQSQVLGVKLTLTEPVTRSYLVEKGNNQNVNPVVVGPAYISSSIPGKDPYQKEIIDNGSGSAILIINCLNIANVRIFIEDHVDGAYFDGIVPSVTCENAKLILTQDGGAFSCDAKRRLSGKCSDGYGVADVDGAWICEEMRPPKKPRLKSDTRLKSDKGHR